jgi:hypothetical protein
VVAVDTITDELKRTIEYLNGHTITEIEISFAWGYGIAHPSTNAWFNVEGKATCVWSCYARSTTATWDVNFEYLIRNEVSGPRIDRLAVGLRAIPGVQARLTGLEAASFRKRPSLAIDAIVSKPGVVDQILAVLDDLVDPVDGQPV